MLIKCRNGLYVSIGACSGVKGVKVDAHCIVYLRPAEGGVKPLTSAGQSVSSVQGSRSRVDICHGSNSLGRSVGLTPLSN